jgi:O-antigen/teichoic acid export membrane protein
MKVFLPDLMLGRFFFQRVYKSQLGQNILTNYLAVVWMGGLSIVLIPLYLKRLGPDQWGIVAICMAIQGFLGLLDAGLGQIMPRDIARVAGDPVAEARVFRVFSQSYLSLGLFGLVLGQASVPWLIEHWFNQGRGISNGADVALRLVLMQFMFQFANNAHIGYWNGLQAQGLANLRQCAFGTIKHAGALALVYIWRADACAYLIPFVLVSVMEWCANRYTVQRVLGDRIVGETTFADFGKLTREAGVLALSVVIGMLVSQIDRIVVCGFSFLRTLCDRCKPRTCLHAASIPINAGLFSSRCASRCRWGRITPVATGA